MPRPPNNLERQPPGGAEPNPAPRLGCADGPADPASIDLDALAEAVAEKLAERLASLSAKRYFSVQESATYTGLSVDSIRSLLSSGKLSGYRCAVAGRVLVDRKELDALVQGSTKRPRQGRGRYDRSA